MTLIVGIRCKDGVVVAADSAVTFGVGNLHTIAERDCKIAVIDSKVIVAGTGQVGLAQRFRAVLTDLWANRKLGGNEFTASQEMCRGFIQNAQSTGAKGGYGALVAFPADRKHSLVEFPSDTFQPELKTDTMWFASMGSGQILADPYLALMRRVFWEDGPPALQNGKFAAVWVLRQAIDAAPGGIAGPIDMAVLEADGKGWQAKMISKDELLEHEQFAAESIKHFRQFAARKTSVASIPTLDP